MTPAEHGASVARLELDTAKCTGLGICEAMAPELFEVQDDGSLVVLRSEVGAADLATAREAVASCPTEALRLVAQ